MCSMFLRIFVWVCVLNWCSPLQGPCPFPMTGLTGLSESEWLRNNRTSRVSDPLSLSRAEHFVRPTGGAGPASRPIGRCEAANYIAAFGDAHKWIGFLVFPCHITPLPKKRKQRLLKSEIYEVRCSINCNKSPKSTQQEGEAGGIGKKKMNSQSEGTLAASLLGTRKQTRQKVVWWRCSGRMFLRECRVSAWWFKVYWSLCAFFCGRSLEALIKSGRDFQSLMWQRLLQGDTCGKTEAIQVARRSATFDSEKLLLSKGTRSSSNKICGKDDHRRQVNQEGYAKLVSHDAPIQVCLAKAWNTAVMHFVNGNVKNNENLEKITKQMPMQLIPICFLCFPNFILLSRFCLQFLTCPEK